MKAGYSAAFAIKCGRIAGLLLCVFIKKLTAPNTNNKHGNTMEHIWKVRLTKGKKCVMVWLNNGNAS